MSESYVVAVEGISAMAGVDDLPKAIITAARRAVNKTTDHARTVAGRRIQAQVNFAARYLTGTDSSGRQRLGVTQKATDQKLEGIVAGRDRPTSLARFVKGSTGKGDLKVSVKPGSSRTIQRAFLFQLKSGNTGLAIRTAGGAPRSAYKPTPIGKNLYLLFGPSVDQVFGGSGVAEEIAPEMADYLEVEFNRLMALEI